MVVTDKNELEPVSDSSSTSSNAKNESYQYNANLHNQNHSNSIEKHSLLSDVNKVKLDILNDENQMKMQNMNGFNKELDEKKIDINDPEIGPIKGEYEPPDGGFRAWSIMIGSFIINGILFSVINSYSPVNLNIIERLNSSGIHDTASKAALVGSLQLGTTFCMSPVAGIFTNKIGIQMTTFLGGLIASLGMFLSSFVLDKIELLCLTYGIMYGLGASLAYSPSLVILGHYFKRYLGLVNGIVTAGSAIFTIVMPYTMAYLIDHYGLKTLMVCLGVITCSVMATAFLFKPIDHDISPVVEKSKVIHKTTLSEKLKSIVNLSILKRRKYLIWAIAMPIAVLAYQVPYIHVGQFVKKHFGEDYDKNLPITCLGITSGIGRLAFGFIADLPRINKIYLQQIAFTCLGLLMMLLSIASSYTMVIIIYLFMGLFDGCFISLLGPIAFEICGKKDATTAISLLLGLCAIPITAGSTFASFLYDRTDSYPLTFLISGIPPIVATLAMFAVKCVKDEITDDSTDPAGEFLTSPAWQTDFPNTIKTTTINEEFKTKDSNELHETPVVTQQPERKDKIYPDFENNSGSGIHQ